MGKPVGVQRSLGMNCPSRSCICDIVAAALCPCSEAHTYDVQVFVFPHTPFYCQCEHGPSAATAYVRAGGSGPGRRSAGRRGVEPALILQGLIHGRFAGSKGDGVEGELEQRAGEGPLNCDGDDAAPARDIGRTQSRANGSVRTCSSSSCKEPQETGRLGTPTATNLNRKYHEVASR